MEILDKLTLNNKIIEMRPAVKRSRIQAINRLVKEIKRLKEKKGTDEQKAKNHAKADKLVEIIKLMNKLKEDDISKFALINEKPFTEITNDVTESLEIKAVARITNHRPIYESVRNFREQFPEWKEVLPILFDTLGVRHQNKKPKKKSSSSIKNKSRVKKKETSQNGRKDSDVSYLKNKSGVWKIEALNVLENNEDLEKESPSNKKDVDMTITENICNKKVNVKNKINVASDQLLKKKKLSSETQNTVEINKSEKSGSQLQSSPNSEISSNNISKIVEYDEKQMSSNDEDDNSFKLQKITRIADPFFITKNNKEYLSVNIPNSSNEVMNIKDRSRDKETAFKSYKNFVPGDNINHKRESILKSNEKKNKEFKSFKSTDIGMKPMLHPSWEAKKKQATIQEFKGKKIKFED